MPKADKTNPPPSLALGSSFRESRWGLREDRARGSGTPTPATAGVCESNVIITKDIITIPDDDLHIPNSITLPLNPTNPDFNLPPTPTTPNTSHLQTSKPRRRSPPAPIHTAFPFKPDYPPPSSSTLPLLHTQPPAPLPPSPTPSPYLAIIPPPPLYSPLPPTRTLLDEIHQHVLQHPVPVFDDCDVIRRKFVAFFKAFPDFRPVGRGAFKGIGKAIVMPATSPFPSPPSSDETGRDKAALSDGTLLPPTPTSPHLPSPASRFPQLLYLLSQEHPQCATLGADGFLWFMSLQGERQGMKSCFYYAGYVLFERLRIAKGWKKGERRRREEKRVGGVGGWLGWKPRKRSFERWVRYPA